MILRAQELWVSFYCKSSIKPTRGGGTYLVFDSKRGWGGEGFLEREVQFSGGLISNPNFASKLKLIFQTSFTH